VVLAKPAGSRKPPLGRLLHRCQHGNGGGSGWNNSQNGVAAYAYTDSDADEYAETYSDAKAAAHAVPTADSVVMGEG
jgi:hypothetical protein